MSKKEQHQQIKNQNPIPCKVILVGDQELGKPQ